MSFVNSYRYASGGGYQYIIDELSITALDVLAFKVLTVNAGQFCVRIQSAAVDYDIAWDENLELSKNSLVYDTGGSPTGDTFGDIAVSGVELVRWYEQTTGGTNYLVCTNVDLTDDVNGDFTNFNDIYWDTDNISNNEMNNTSSLGALPVSFYAYDKPSPTNSNLYYFGNTGLNPTLYIRQPSGLYRMRNGGSPFLSLGTPRITWGHELANFTSTGTGQTHYIDNVLNVTGTSNNTTQFTKLKLGGGCDFRFAMSFDGNLNTSDRDDLYNYMAIYY